MTPSDRIYNGDRAREVLENEAFQGAFEAIEQEFIEKWKNSPARDRDGRESIWTYLMLLQKVRTHLEAAVFGGNQVQLDLQHEQRMQDMRTEQWDGPSLRRA